MNPKTGKRVMDIHTKDEGNGPHAHRWNGSDRGAGIPLTQGQRNFLEKIKQMAKDLKK